MNRPLKFRIFDFTYNCFFYSNVVDGFDLTRTGECSAPQQFTGIIDTNEKEVYEGDIIEYFDWCYANGCAMNNGIYKFYWKRENSRGEISEDVYSPLIGEVRWDNEHQTYEPTICAEEDYFFNNFSIVCSYKCDEINSLGKPNYPDSYYKVIGNIFENKELLEK